MNAFFRRFQAFRDGFARDCLLQRRVRNEPSQADARTGRQTPGQDFHCSGFPIEKRALICSMTFSSASLSRSLGRWRVGLALDVPHVSRRILIARKSAVADRLNELGDDRLAVGDLPLPTI